MDTHVKCSFFVQNSKSMIISVPYTNFHIALSQVKYIIDKDISKKEFTKAERYGFLEPVAAVLGNRKKGSHTMKLYKKSPKFFYLRRVGNNDQHFKTLGM